MIKICISVNRNLRPNWGYKKYKLLDITKFILVFPTFRLTQYYQGLDAEWKVYILF